jgi:hypothetical protein
MSEEIGARPRRISSTDTRAVLKQPGEVHRLTVFDGYEHKFLLSKLGNMTANSKLLLSKLDNNTVVSRLYEICANSMQHRGYEQKILLSKVCNMTANSMKHRYDTL